MVEVMRPMLIWFGYAKNPTNPEKEDGQSFIDIGPLSDSEQEDYLGYLTLN